MITADQARMLSDNNATREINFTLDEVCSLIKEECEKGNLHLFLEGNIGEQTAYELQKNGFNVEFSKKPTKLAPNNITFFINWQTV